MTLANLLAGLLIVSLFVVLVCYVTYLFVYRIRRGQAPAKSFAIWLRDFFDTATGLG